MNSISWWFPTCSRIERDQVGNGDEIVLLGAGEAKRKLYEVRLDPQYWYDKAIERSWEKKLLAIFFENIRCVYFCPVLFFEGKRQNTVGVGIWWRKAFFFGDKVGRLWTIAIFEIAGGQVFTFGIHILAAELFS